MGRKKQTIDAGPSADIRNFSRQLLHVIDQNHYVFLIFLIIFLFSSFYISLDMKQGLPVQAQIKDVKSRGGDGSLYYALAENIVNGTGYFDTYRHMEIMPSVGHPLLLAILCVVLRLPPITATLFLLVSSAVLLALAVRIYTRSNICVVCTMLLYGSFFRYIQWLTVNVECSLAFGGSLLIFTLACLYKSDFRTPWPVIAGAALAMHILIRPLYLFPTHICSLIVLAVVLYHYIRRRNVPLNNFIKGWFIALAATQGILLSVYCYSHLAYNDSRLITGTYGAWPLYTANNIHIPPEHRYLTKRHYLHFKEFAELHKLVGQKDSGVSWQERHKLLMRKVTSYWKSHPKRALRGWWWRFRQFTAIHPGLSFLEPPFRRLHTLSVSALLMLILIRVISACIYEEQKIWSIIKSPGLLVAGLFFLYSAIHALFVYAGYRYVTPAFTLLVTAITFLLFETRKLCIKIALSITRLTKKLCLE